ncbi:MAG TPA: hypothetical protein VLA88_04250 [Candidatus Saccharimonadales bacterium]|nr:hypothetical protein [Candidatus Saccharimonadales bacterium]
MRNPLAQHLILPALALVGATAAFVLLRGPIDRSRSVSLHVASEPHTIWLFAIASTIATVPMALFMVGWFIPALQLPAWFTVIFMAALAGQLIAAWIPHNTGWRAAVHQFCAYLMAYLMVPLVVFILFSPALPLWAKAIIGVILAWMIFSLALYHLSAKAKLQFLLYQSGYVASFYMVLLVATYAPHVNFT